MKRVACRYCHTDITDETPRAQHRGQHVDPRVCNGCRRDDAEDYAGITREEARAEENR